MNGEGTEKKSAVLVAWPKGVTTEMWPDVAPDVTEVLICEELADPTVAVVPFSRSVLLAAVVWKFVPSTVTAVPATPIVGAKLKMVGDWLVVTVNGALLDAEPVGVDTLTGPVLAPEGTSVTIALLVAEITLA